MVKEFVKRILLDVCKDAEILVDKIEKKCGYGKSQYILNLNKNAVKEQKRVLIAYMDYVYVGKELADAPQHSNRYEFCQIIYYFLKYDYVLDICACNDISIIDYVKRQNYDVIFGLGQVFREAALRSKAYKILYMTENPYDISYQREQERIQYFYERHKIKTKMVRTGIFYYKDDEKLADAVICMGDEKYFSGLNVDVKRIWPTAIANPYEISFSDRDIKNFLVLGTDGFIHKGIDLLVEIFSIHKDWNLYLCGYNITKTLKKLKYSLLPNNIHDCGYIDVTGKCFVELAQKCTYLLSTSCSEGLSTSVLTAMYHGLLPVIMKGNGMDDLEEYCLYFDGYHLEDIENAINYAISKTKEECKIKAMKIMEYARERFTIERFNDTLERTFNVLLETEKDESCTF